MEIEVRGRDLVTGLPRQVVVTDSDIREAISASINTLVEGIREVLETTPPEILSDVMHRGIVLTGGGSLIKGLPELIQKAIKMPVHISEDPLTAVARGTGVILENLEKYKDVLIDTQYDLPPR